MIQKPCYITHTSTEVHNILKTGFEKSPMFAGRIQGLGPRYCPSIEDKINRFADKETHQLFVEPEGWDTVEIYVNGFSTSLPEEVQFKALRKIVGFENCKMFRPGYAIEYDYFPPTQLDLSLETKLIKNLFFAGQINGTTGYEEAACQGLIAGVNAHRAVNDLERVVLKRSDAYIGVLIDDLVNKGTDEPYRMFTSRAEFRILLRQDNADLRLTELSHSLGFAEDERLEKVLAKKKNKADIVAFLKTEAVTSSEINQVLIDNGSSPLSQNTKLFNLINRPQIDMNILRKGISKLDSFLNNYDKETIEQAEIFVKYEGYIAKELEMVEKVSRLESVKLNPDFDYRAIGALSFEGKDKLSKAKPTTLGQASRISGVKPADISILLVYLGR